MTPQPEYPSPEQVSTNTPKALIVPTETVPISKTPTPTASVSPTDTLTPTTTLTPEPLCPFDSWVEHSRGGMQYPAELLRIDKPILDWDDERTEIQCEVGGVAKPIFTDVYNIAYSRWAKDNQLKYQFTTVGECGYGVMFKPQEEWVWATYPEWCGYGQTGWQWTGVGVSVIPNPNLPRAFGAVGGEQTKGRVGGGERPDDCGL